MRATHLLPILLSLVACDYRGFARSNGLDRQLRFHAPSPIATGEQAPLRVAFAEGQEFCFSIKGTVCNTTSGGNLNPVTQILSGTCDQPDCQVLLDTAINDGGDNQMRVMVRSERPGQAIASLRVKLKDGSERSDRFGLTFVAPQRLSVSCTDVSQCGARHAVFAGTTVTWRAQVEADDSYGQPQVLYAGIVAAVDGDSLALDGEWKQGLDEPSWPSVTLRTPRPGPSSVRITGGGFTRMFSVRVVEEKDVVAGELLRIASPLAGVPVGEELADLRPIPAQLWFGDTRGRNFPGDSDDSEFVEAVPLLTLADGGRAVGGAGRVRCDHSELLDVLATGALEDRLPETPAETLAHELHQTGLMLFPIAAGKARLTGTVGGASLGATVDVVPAPMVR